jgi:hypothetical protein
MTLENAYANTPHKTLADLLVCTRNRVLTGEHPFDVIQDIVNGYGLGWGSENQRLIERDAIEARLESGRDRIDRRNHQ